MVCIQGHLPNLNEVAWTELLLGKRIGLGSNVSACRPEEQLAYGRKAVDPLGEEVTALTSDLSHIYFGCEAES